MFENKTLQEGWESYKKILPANACDAQISETRNAFYAGAMYSFNLIVAVSGETENEDSAVKMIEGIQDEINTFFSEPLIL